MKKKNKYIIALVFLGWVLSMVVIGYNMFDTEQARNSPMHNDTSIHHNPID